MKFIMNIKALTKFFFILTICLFSITSVNCAVSQNEFRAYIDQDPHWKIVEMCGFQGCYPMVDVLTGENISIRFDFHKRQQGQLIYVTITFLEVDGIVTFNPTCITAVLNHTKPLQIKIFERSRLISDAQYLQLMTPLKGEIQIQKGDCYLLFVDYQSLTNENITINIDNVFTLEGKKLKIPRIDFKRNPAYQD